MRTYTNIVAKVLFWTGIVYLVLTVIGGIALGDIFEIVDIGYYSTSTEFNWIYTIVAWITGFMFSLLFFGAAEIIELLQRQKDETTRLIGALSTHDDKRTQMSGSRKDITRFDDLPEL